MNGLRCDICGNEISPVIRNEIAVRHASLPQLTTYFDLCDRCRENIENFIYTEKSRLLQRKERTDEH